MKRNVLTGETTFNKEETDIVAFAISDRCDCMLNWYRTAVVTNNSGAAEYFSRAYKDACGLYKVLFGKDYPADSADGPVPDSANT